MAIQSALILAELTTAVEAAIATDPLVAAALKDTADKGRDIAKSIAPVGERAHRVSQGHIDEPGDYRDSIYSMLVFANGRPLGRFGSHDFKAHWIEYGTKKMPAQAVLRRAAAMLQARE